MKKLFYIGFLSVLLFGCGVKKGYVIGDFGKQPLYAKIVSDNDANDNSMSGKATLGLWWQRDSLQITLNKGHQLKAARVKGDTLYLYETPHDTTDVATRQYTLYIPQQELLIIKYNDSLVYPIMPAAEPCEYPLDIKSMGPENIKKYNKISQDIIDRQRKSGLWSGMANAEIEPLELRSGIYLFNASLYSYGSDCECIMDSSQTLVLNIDGSWQQYKDNRLQNCGIMRKFKLPVSYEAFSYKGKIVFFSDTSSVQFLTYNERKEKRENNIPWKSSEYDYKGKTSSHECSLFTLYSCKKDSMMHHFYDGDDDKYRTRVLMLEGASCGWIQIKTNN